MSGRRKGKPATPATRQQIVSGTPLGVLPRQTTTATWQGPVPPPQSLAGFGEIDQSFPERIVKMAESAAQHQRDMEREAMRQQGEGIKIDSDIRRRGQNFAAGLAVFFGLVGGWGIYLGHPTAGATIISGTVVGLATAFIIGRTTNSK